MAKWRTEEQAFEGAIRAINYVVAGQNEDDTVVIKFRLEQLGPWGWKTIPVYQEQSDGSLVEIPQ